MSIDSNAFNFSEAVTAGVDTRTGGYSMSIALGQAIFQKGSGLALNLSLGYSAAGGPNIGFGRGWALNLSRYDPGRRKLYLSTGQSFKIEWNHSIGEYEIPYRRLKDIKVLWYGKDKNGSSENQLKVVHKDGRIEYINYETGNLIKMSSPIGHVLHFSYWRKNGLDRLWLISEDGEGKLGRAMHIDTWSDRWESRVTHQFNGKELYLLRFKLDGGQDKRLQSIELPLIGSYSINYRYSKQTGYDLIETVTHPSGLIEKVTYLDSGHSLQNGAPQSSIPFVTEHRLYPGSSQPVRYTSYSYSDKNFLGFGSSAKWQAGEDTLFTARNDYQYTTTEVINGEQTTVRTYNKYHLLEREEVFNNGLPIRTEERTYFATLSRHIQHQPATYTLMKSKRTTYYDGGDSRTVETSYDYDDYGNQILVREADGSKTIREFYPIAGEQGKCPREPNGFVSLLKKESFHPAITSNGERPRQSLYTYQMLDTLLPGSNYAVLLASTANPTEKVEVAYYEDKNQVFEYGRIKAQRTTVNNYVTIESFKYQFGIDEVATENAFTTHDGLQLVTKECLSLLNDKIVERSAADGFISRFTFDGALRPIGVTIAAGTPYQANETISYKTNSAENEITRTDAFGNRLLQRLNNAGNLIEEDITDENGQFRTVKRISYNAFGQPEDVTEFDYIDSAAIENSVHYEHDPYGEVSKVTHKDGRVESTAHNRVNLTVCYNNDGLVEETTEFNLSGQEIRKETRDIANGRVLARTRFTYDGFGNLLSTQDTRGHVTRHTYDTFDRLATTTKQVDGRNVTETYRYADFTNEVLITAVDVNGQVLGTRQYDGLGRLLSENRGGGTQGFQYKGTEPEPSKVTTPLGEQIHYVNHDFYGVPLSQRVSGQPRLDCSFSYHKLSGEQASHINANSKSETIYNNLGQVIHESLNQRDGIKRTASYRSSLRGKRTYEEDFFGNSTRYYYDSFGRLEKLVSKEAGHESTTLVAYDSHGRAITFDTMGQKQRVQVALKFNSLGLETSRVITVNGTHFSTIDQTFNDEQQLIERVCRQGDKVTKETMAYNTLHQLTSYTVAGPEAPEDGMGNSISEQTYQYDVLGNITDVTTSFIDGSTDVASCTFDPTDPVRLKSVSHSHASYPPTIDLQYDASGNLLVDELGRNISYNALGQIASVSKGGQVLSDYHFDAEGKMIAQSVAGGLQHLFYQGGDLVNEAASGAYSSIQHHGAGVTSRTVVDGGQSEQSLLLKNAQGSISTELAESRSMKTRAYTPYGQG